LFLFNASLNTFGFLFIEELQAVYFY